MAKQSDEGRPHGIKSVMAVNWSAESCFPLTHSSGGKFAPNSWPAFKYSVSPKTTMAVCLVLSEKYPPLRWVTSQN